jgi:hypothetical protein
VIPRKRDIEVVIASIDNFYKEIANHAQLDYHTNFEQDNESGYGYNQEPERVHNHAAHKHSLELEERIGKNIFGDEDSSNDEDEL